LPALAEWTGEGSFEDAASRLLGSVNTLVGFHNRHSCGNSGASGVNLAAEWITQQYKSIVNLNVLYDEFLIPALKCYRFGLRQRNVIAVLQGGEKANEIILVGGHYDSRDESNFSSTSFAPGANDSGSQTAVLLETARELSKTSHNRTIVFASFAGEEIGMTGSQHFVKNLPAIFPNKKVVAMLNLDIVGGDNSEKDEAFFKTYRLYVPNRQSDLALAKRIQEINTERYPEFQMLLHTQVDRPNRGGDQISFQNAGIPAVRFIEAKENTDHQHSARDLAEFITPTYMAKIAKLIEFVTEDLAE